MLKMATTESREGLNLISIHHMAHTSSNHQRCICERDVEYLVQSSPFYCKISHPAFTLRNKPYDKSFNVEAFGRMVGIKNGYVYRTIRWKALQYLVSLNLAFHLRNLSYNQSLV